MSYLVQDRHLFKPPTCPGCEKPHGHVDWKDMTTSAEFAAGEVRMIPGRTYCVTKGCAYNQFEQAPKTRYETPTISDRQPLVIWAPETTLMSVEMLRDMAGGFVAGPDRVCLGDDQWGVRVWYQITGWEPEHRALILTRAEAGQ